MELFFSCTEKLCYHILIIAEACNFTKINSPPWVFFTFFKLYKCYQIAQRITYGKHCYYGEPRKLILPLNLSFHGTISIIVPWWYLHITDIVQRDIKPANVLMSNSHYKSYKHEELEIAFGKKTYYLWIWWFGWSEIYVHRLAL